MQHRHARTGLRDCLTEQTRRREGLTGGRWRKRHAMRSADRAARAAGGIQKGLGLGKPLGVTNVVTSIWNA
jgi:hypothetical protein